ncbi:MAG TPA: histidine--tRNA ligase [Spirochaetales bacterium]|nr:histidine--tRNA ligase [Spirochaetales bacterium]
MEKQIEPRLLKGFRDFLPQMELFRRQIMRKLEKIFRLFGFLPIDTPVLEYAEILLGKGGGETDKQVYRFHDHGQRDIALRYDLTVPFARFMAQHLNELALPFKRYHIGKVWRGENTQRGRYREFTQIDFDIVGVDSASADFEILLLMFRSMAALGIEKFKIHFFHRGLYNNLLKHIGLEKKSIDILRAIDKSKKIGKENVAGLLKECGCGDHIERILSFIQPGVNFNETLENITAQIGSDSQEITRLHDIQQCIADMGLDNFFLLDPAITRGLDYYTGIVYETFLTDIPQIGSVCSGGRYNNLASLYTRAKLPGVGSSIGLDRLIAALEELKLLKEITETISTPLLILFLDQNLLSYYHQLAAAFHERGIAAEVFPVKKKLSAQFNYAQKKSIPLALICGELEMEKGSVTIKDLRSRQSYENLILEQAIAKVTELSPG